MTGSDFFFPFPWFYIVNKKAGKFLVFFVFIRIFLFHIRKFCLLMKNNYTVMYNNNNV